MGTSTSQHSGFACGLVAAAAGLMVGATLMFAFPLNPAAGATAPAQSNAPASSPKVTNPPAGKLPGNDPAARAAEPYRELGVAVYYGTEGILSLITLALVGGFIRAMRGGRTVSVETNWGGLGGGASGWQISQPLALLIACIVFGILVSILAISGPPGSGKTGKPAGTEAKQ